MLKRVLIVDDMAFVRKTLRDILVDAYCEVVGEAADGAEAVQLYEKLKPDLVTMDVVMPHMSGIEATRRILALDKNAKIIMISAMGQETLMMEAIHAGASDYLMKPFLAKDIVQTVDRLYPVGVGMGSRSFAKKNSV